MREIDARRIPRRLSRLQDAIEAIQRADDRLRRDRPQRKVAADQIALAIHILNEFQKENPA